MTNSSMPDAGLRRADVRGAGAWLLRHGLGDGSDTDRIKRQQKFMGSLAGQAMSAGVLSNPRRMLQLMNAVTKSLTTDMDSVINIAKIGVGFKSIGLDKIKFITVPIQYDQREAYRGRVDWVQPQTDNLWKLIADDKPLPKEFLNGAITAAQHRTAERARERITGRVRDGHALADS